MADLPPNHHAHYRQFSGPFGYVAALTMMVGRGKDAELVCDLAGIDETDRVLDIGCGPGTAARHAVRRGADVTGVDPSRPMLQLASLITRIRRLQKKITWLEARAENLTLPDEAFTVTWSLASVHHWPELDQGLAETRRTLQSGGTFIAVEKRAEPGATGNASHGWTKQQAETFAKMLNEGGFSNAVVSDHDLGKRKLIAVMAEKT